VHLAKGKSLYQRTKYEEAIIELDTALRLNPDHPDVPLALRCKGDCYKQLKQPDKAIALYDEILEKYPEHRITEDTRKAKTKVEELGYF